MIIYLITNNKNDKKYVGQTVRTIDERIRGYQSELQKRGNKRLIARAMYKHGFENFTFSVLYEGDCTEAELTEKEEYFIDYYNTCDNRYGYNLKRAAVHGGHSDETKRKIGDAQKGSLNHMFGVTGKDNLTSKKVLELTTGKYYYSVSDASKELKLNLSHCAAVARGERGSTGGYVFRYVDENDIPILNPNRSKIKFKKVLSEIRPEYVKYI